MPPPTMPLRSRPRLFPPQPPPRPHLGHFASWPSMVGWARSGSRLRMAVRVRETCHRGCALPARVRRGSAPCVSVRKARPDHQEVRPDRQTGPHAPARGCGTRVRADAAHAQMRCSTHARMRHMTRVTARPRLSHGRLTCAFAFRLSHCLQAPQRRDGNALVPSRERRSRARCSTTSAACPGTGSG